MPIDHALFAGGRLTIRASAAGIWAGFVAAPAAAQQTPQTYCASLPATSCEVLNVDLVSGLTSGGGGMLYFLVKQCLNKQFATRVFAVYPLGTVGQGSAVLSNLYPFNGTYQMQFDSIRLPNLAGSTTDYNGATVQDFAKTCY